MTLNEFEAALKIDHYSEVLPITRAAGYAMNAHSHTFDARALITAGEFTLVVGGVPRTYGVGDIFQLPAGTLHEERSGPDGASYLAGRREVLAK